MLAKKVFMLGLDGVPLDLLMKYAKTGILPTFNKLFSGGSFGELTSTIPPVTFPAWKSMTSGINPGKIGVYGFLKIYLSQKKASLNVSISNSAKDFWEFISDRGYICSIINVPGTWPTKKINGYLIAGPMVLDTMNYTFPSYLKKFIVEKFRYRVNPTYDLKENDETAFNELLSMIKSRFSVAKYLLNKSDFTFLVIYYIDNLMHYHWDKLENPPNKNPILKAFMLIDKEINKIFQKYPNIDLLIVSDHGMTAQKGVFRLNTYLYKSGLMALTKKMPYPPLYSILRFPNIAKKIERVTLQIYRMIGEKLLETFKFANVDSIRNLYRIVHSKGAIPGYELIKMIDAKRTLCFAHGYSIYINQNIKMPTEQLIEKIRDILANITNPKNKEKIISDIWLADEIYGGVVKQPAPVLLFLPKEGYGFNYALSREIWMKGEWKAVHKRNGLFLAYGPDFANNNYIGEMSIYDVAPTLLYLYNIKVPSYMEGKPIKNCFP